MTPPRPRARWYVAPRTTRALAGVVLLAALAGCGGEGDTGGGEAGTADATASASDTPSTSPSTSPSATASAEGGADDVVDAELDDGRFTSSAYAFTLPDGWQDGSEQTSQPMIGAVGYDPGPGRVAFSDNVNVVVNTDAPPLSAQQLERQLVREAADLTETTRVRDRTDIAGLPAVHLSATGNSGASTGKTGPGSGSVPIAQEQYATYSEQVLFIVTFTHARATPTDERVEDVEAVLGSWEWPDTEAS